MAGLRVVVVGCDRDGNVDLADLRAKVAKHARPAGGADDHLSQHARRVRGAIRDICAVVHDAGGQVYMDGANMNAQVGLTSPAPIGADVCHLNLHKTFCIPHGGGGPGVGPIGVAAHLVPFLPNHPLRADAGPASGVGPVVGGAVRQRADPADLLCLYPHDGRRRPDARDRGGDPERQLHRHAAARRTIPMLYTGPSGMVAHECIIDCRGFQAEAGVMVEDIAKRLQDFGFHAPTMSWPVAGTLMIEPTESESKAELDRFCDAMIAIRAEIAAIAAGTAGQGGQPAEERAAHRARGDGGAWTHAYSREQAAFPLPSWRRRNTGRRSSGWTTFMATATWCAPARRWRRMPRRRNSVSALAFSTFGQVRRVSVSQRRPLLLRQDPRKLQQFCVHRLGPSDDVSERRSA